MSLPTSCLGRRGCTHRDHQARGLCNACYKHYYNKMQINQFPLTQARVSRRQRYEDWVASGMRVKDYAAHVGIPTSSLSRALRSERERLKRHGASYIDGYRRVQVV
jgi:hypothetical protein